MNALLDRIFNARRRPCSVADIVGKRSVSRSRAAGAWVIKGDADAAREHTAYGGAPRGRPCLSTPRSLPAGQGWLLNRTPGGSLSDEMELTRLRSGQTWA
jgi:hypothetical protein